MTYTVKLAILGVAAFALALGFFFVVLGDSSDAADKPQPQAQVAPPVKANPAAAYLVARAPLGEKWLNKLRQIQGTYMTTTMLTYGGPAAAAKLDQDLAELKAISTEMRALTPPDCLDRAVRFHLAATNVAETAIGSLVDALRFNHASDFEVAALALKDTATMMDKAKAQLNAADCG